MSALALRLIACITMLIDHIGYQINSLECRLIGRIAFPIFVFLIVNGYHHTSNKVYYALRLMLFAIISQIPFSLFCDNRIDFSHGNVMMTLFFALICIWTADVMGKNRCLRYISLLPSLLVCILYHFGVISSDYDAKGILLALLFFFADHKTVKGRIVLLLGMPAVFMYGYILSGGEQCVRLLLGMECVWPQVSVWDLRQLCCIGSLIPIFLYNGKKGTYPQSCFAAKLLQYGFYAFYPLHMLILWLIF